MAISLEELKQQRAQIQQHLEWLDAKISELSPTYDATAPDRDPPVNTPSPKENETRPSLSPHHDATTDELSSESPAPTIPLDTKPGSQHTLPSGAQSATTRDAPEIQSNYKPKTQREVQRAKIGCLAFFILATALFLFLLFGLPYLL